jgi:hypothetical protein
MAEQDTATSLKVIEGGKGTDKLTARQQGFVNSILAGEDQVTAYEQNYTTSGMTRKTMYEAASRLFANSKVSARIKSGQARLDEAALLSGLATRQHIQRTLFGLTKDGENDAAKLRACDLLGRLTDVAAFTERVEQVPNDATPEEVKSELEERLKKAFGG